MFVAVASLLLDASARSDVAVSGEITLRGRILPVSGIKDKVLAAHRGGIRMVIMPARNERDLEDVPDEIRQDLEIHLVSRIDEVLPLVLAPPSDSDSERDRATSPPSGGEARP
jgi:ATP-dependent Lon protease